MQPAVRLFALLRSALYGLPTDEPLFATCTAGEWEALFRLSVEQQVAALAWDGVGHLPERLQPPRAVSLCWRSEYQQTIDNTRHRLQVSKQLVAYFAGQGIRTYLLKGVRISACYPKPALRQFNDIDIYQDSDWQRGDQLVRDQLGIAISGTKHHHTTYRFEHETIENHYQLLNPYKYRSNIRYEREMLRYFGTPAFDALFLLRHTAIHFGVEQIKMRHLCDWAMFVGKHEEDVDWAVVNDFCRRYNMDRFLAALMGLIEEQLQYAFAQLPAGSNKDLRHRVLDDMLAQPAKGSRLRQFLRNRWKFRITFSDSLASALCSRMQSMARHKK